MSNKYIRKLIDSYCVLDCETTGFSIYYNEIIEIGIVKVRNNIIVDKLQTLVNPSCLIPDHITNLTGITNEMVINAPLINEIKNNVLSFIGDDVILGHNTSFDINFINNKLDNAIQNQYMDTLPLCRKLFTEYKNHRLSDMAVSFDLSRNNHRSIDDCICTKELYDLIKRKIDKEGIEFDKLFYKKTNKYIDIKNIVASTDFVDDNNLFYGKYCVFTGVLEKMVRKDAMQLVVNVGGYVENGVTKKTNFLILGNNDYCKSIKDGKSSKHKKAEDLKFKGQDIEVLDENTFYNLIM